MTSHYVPLLAIGLIVLGVILLIGYGISQNKGKAEVRGGGVVFIGPIPIVFGSDSSVIPWLVVLSIIALIVFLAMSRGFL